MRTWQPDPLVLPITEDPAGFDARLAEVPDRPAVFLIWPREGSPYLAKTGLLRRRLRRLLGERSRPTRLLHLRALAERVEYWPAGSRLETMLLHYHLAAQHFPEQYLELLKLRMPTYVKITMSNEYPRTQITSRLSGGRGLYYGPFRSRASAELFEGEALELFQIRRCQEDFTPSPDHPGCIYGEMSKCLRPCQQAVSAEEYRTEVERVVAFMQTAGHSLVEPLEAARERMSQELRFEDAAREHKRIEKVQEVLKLRDDMVADIDRLHGVAVTSSAEAGCAELWFVVSGCWKQPVRFGSEVVEGKTVSLDHRLREIVAALDVKRPSMQERQEHLALLARWGYSSWRDGDWIPFGNFEHVPYRRLVRAISRQTVRPGDAGAAHAMKP